MESRATTRLILIRHGQSVDNVAGRISGWTDSALTPLGVEQAGRTAEFVAREFTVSALYASPLRRAYETAARLAPLTGHAVTTRAELRELHFGDVEGLSELELRDRFAEHARRALDEDDVTFAWPNGESRAEFYRRARHGLDAIARDHPGGTVAVVSHGGVISSLVADVIEGKASYWRRHLVSNCSVSEMQFDDGTVSIVRWNLTDHLL